MSEAAQLQDEKEPPPPIRIYNELSEDQTEVTPHVNHFDHPIRPSSFSVWPPREIGKGRFSKVFQTKLGDADVVLKVCEKLPWADVETSDLDKELDILSHIGRHPNLIYPVAVCEHLVDAGLTENTCYDIGPVFPLKAGGNLEDFVQRHPEVIDDPVSLRNILLGVCRGVQALHKQQIVHRDIACRNFLVDQSGRIVLSDFGLSRRLIENGESWFEETLEHYQHLYYKQQRSIVAFRWVSPESLITRKFTLRSDLWSIGVLCLELAAKCEGSPLEPCTSAAQVALKFKSNPDYANDDLPDGCSPLLRQFVKKCCNTTPELRPTIDELIEHAKGAAHPFFDEASCKKTQFSPSTSDPPRVTPSDFSPAKWQCIGSGRFSAVYKSTLNGEDVAVKVGKKQYSADVEHELAVLKHVGKHPNLMCIKAMCENVDKCDVIGNCFNVGIVLQLHSRGSLEDYVKSHPDVVDHELRLQNILLGICRGVQALHERKVVHRDIACRNFLIDENGRIVLADYGLSRIIPKESDSFKEDDGQYQYLLYQSGGGIFPLLHMAPESIELLRFTHRTDIWSIGIVCIELALRCATKPFPGITGDVALVMAYHADKNLALKQLPPDSPRILHEVTRRCCNVDKDARPRIQELIDFIASFGVLPEPESSNVRRSSVTPSAMRSVRRGSAASPVSEPETDHILSTLRLITDEDILHENEEKSTFAQDPLTYTNVEETSDFPYELIYYDPFSDDPETLTPPKQPVHIKNLQYSHLVPSADHGEGASLSENVYDELHPTQVIIPKVSIEESFWKSNDFRGGFSTVGQGFFGITFRSILSGVPVVLKVSKQRSKRSEKEDYHEFTVNAKLADHSNVLKIFGLCTKFEHPRLPGIGETALISPLQENGNLENFLKEGNRGRSEWEMANIAFGMLLGIRSLHEQGVVHRDIALRNFLVDKDGRIKLCDFGLSRFLGKGKKTLSSLSENELLPWRWLAPESFNGEFSKKSDMWMFGQTLVQLVTGKHPWSQYTSLKDLRQSLEDKSAVLPNLPGCQAIIVEIIADCFKFNPSDRKSADDIFDKIVQWQFQEDDRHRFHKGDTRLHLAARAGSVDKVKELLALKMDQRVRVNAVNEAGETPLMVASNEEVIKVLFAHRPIPVGNKERTIDMQCSHNVDAIGTLRAWIKGNFVGSVWMLGQVEKEHLSHALNEKDSSQRTLLHVAVKLGNCEMVRALLSYYDNFDVMNIHAVDSESQTALHIAARYGHAQIVELLLNHQDSSHRTVDVNAQDKEKKTPLHLATIEGHVATVLAFLENATNLQVNAGDSHGKTALHHAVLKQNEHLVGLLLNHPEAAVGVNVQDNFLKTPFEYAKNLPDGEVASLFLLSGNVREPTHSRISAGE